MIPAAVSLIPVNGIEDRDFCYRPPIPWRNLAR